MDEELEFEKDWLSVEKMEFKILTLITVLIRGVFRSM